MIPFDKRRREIFLRKLAQNGVVTDACDAANVSSKTVYSLADRNPVFRRQMEDARTKAIDRLEREAFRRAVDGVPDIVVSNGKVVRHKGKVLFRTVYSDRLLAILLRAKKPQEYRDNIDVTSDGKPINVTVNIGKGSKKHEGRDRDKQ